MYSDEEFDDLIPDEDDSGEQDTTDDDSDFLLDDDVNVELNEGESREDADVEPDVDEAEDGDEDEEFVKHKLRELISGLDDGDSDSDEKSAEDDDTATIRPCDVSPFSLLEDCSDVVADDPSDAQVHAQPISQSNEPESSAAPDGESPPSQFSLPADFALLNWPRSTITNANKPRSAPPSSPPPFDTSDIYNADFFTYYYRSKLRIMGKRTWLEYDGVRWKSIPHAMVVGYAEECLSSMELEALRLPEPAEQATALRYVQKLRRKATAHDRMVRIALRRRSLYADPNSFDANRELLNTPSGTLDFSQCDSPLRPHEPLDYVTLLCPTPYEPHASCPRWEQFVLEVMNDDPELVDYLQKVLGSCLIGGNQMQALFIAYGDGHNGKGTLFNVLQKVLGADYYGTLDANSLSQGLHKNMIRHDLAQVSSARIVVAAESNQGGKLNESLIKSMTGGDSLRVNRKYQNSYEYTPSWTPFLQTNHLPVIDGSGGAIWRRIRLIPFERKFTMNPNLERELLAEKKGILRWLVGGATKFVEANCVLDRPAKVEQLETKLRLASDSVDGFLDSCCIIGPEAGNETRSTVFLTYEGYCKIEKRRPLGKHAFNAAMEQRGYIPHKDSAGNYVWQNVSLKKPGRSVGPDIPDSDGKTAL